MRHQLHPHGIQHRTRQAARLPWDHPSGEGDIPRARAHALGVQDRAHPRGAHRPEGVRRRLRALARAVHRQTHPARLERRRGPRPVTVDRVVALLHGSPVAAGAGDE